MRRRVASVALALLLTALPHAAASQPAPPPKDTQSAITLGREAKEAYDRGDWKTALDLFNAAEGRAHSPVLLLYIARCQRNLGQLVAARSTYKVLAGETIAADAPEPFKAAKEDAAKDLAALEPRIPTVLINLKNAPPDATVLVDQRVLGAAELASPLALDPGTYQLRILHQGAEIGRAEHNAVEGARADLTLEAKPAPKPPDVIAPPPKPKPAGKDPTLDVLGSIALVLGAGGLGAGIATRVMAFGIVDDVKARCLNDVCPVEDEAEIERAKELQTGSTIGLVLGGALAATGITLLVVSATSDGPSEPNVSLQAGPLGLSLRGSF